MNAFVNFMCENWRLIAGVLIMVITLLIQLIKKKPVLNEIDTILLCVLEAIPKLIVSAEATGAAGDSKKILVVESIKKLVKDQFSVNLPDSLMAFIDTYIEDILSTPQKKAR